MKTWCEWYYKWILHNIDNLCFFNEFKFINGQVARIFLNKRAALREVGHTSYRKRLKDSNPERKVNKQKQAHTRYNAMIDQKVDTVLQDSIIDIVKWVILQGCTILTSSMYIAHRRILPCLNIPTRSFILNVGFARFVVMRTWSFPFHT